MISITYGAFLSDRVATNLVTLLAIRLNIQRQPYIVPNPEKYAKFEESFKYSPTQDQISCFDAISNDLGNKTTPMDRLICGDVGFGKTEVAMRAIYRVALCNKQVSENLALFLNHHYAYDYFIN